MRIDVEVTPQRRAFLAPMIVGAALIVLAVLIVVFPWLLAFIVAVPTALLGALLFAVGMRGRRALSAWREQVQQMGRHVWPPDEQ